MGTSIAKTGGDAVAENRRAQLRSTANKYFEGLTKKDIIRCLKRYVAREIYHLLPAPATTATLDWAA